VSAQDVDEYLRGVEEPKRRTLEALRRTILEIVPMLNRCSPTVCPEGCANSVSCGEVVFVDESAESVAALDGGGWWARGTGLPL
jgi:hypothetical protein